MGTGPNGRGERDGGREGRSRRAGAPCRRRAAVVTFRQVVGGRVPGLDDQREGALRGEKPASARHPTAPPRHPTAPQPRPPPAPACRAPRRHSSPRLRASLSPSYRPRIPLLPQNTHTPHTPPAFAFISLNNMHYPKCFWAGCAFTSLFFFFCLCFKGSSGNKSKGESSLFTLQINSSAATSLPLAALLPHHRNRV